MDYTPGEGHHGDHEHEAQEDIGALQVNSSVYHLQVCLELSILIFQLFFWFLLDIEALQAWDRWSLKYFVLFSSFLI